MVYSLLTCPVPSDVISKSKSSINVLNWILPCPHRLGQGIIQHPTLLMAGVCSVLDAVGKGRKCNYLIGIPINLIYKEDKTVNDKEVAINHSWVRDRGIWYFMGGSVTLLLSVLERNYEMHYFVSFFVV